METEALEVEADSEVVERTTASTALDFRFDTDQQIDLSC